MVKKLTGTEWLRAHMEDNGWTTYEQVAQRCGINRGNLHRYFSFETRPSVDMIPVLCNALKVDIHELLDALEVEKPKQVFAKKKIAKITGAKHLSLVKR
jgi:transcriptional regulator with XRE-family HTH domain